MHKHFFSFYIGIMMLQAIKSGLILEKVTSRTRSYNVATLQR